ncbi:RNA polymerase sigma factor [Paenibacillus sp. QZ-Y1]|uniref:RNA polymerase sigma factor n=1 Tax=Paenibacillus sp. QZ-Y1 TaxID=3414511 RepID=UPI003F795454
MGDSVNTGLIRPREDEVFEDRTSEPDSSLVHRAQTGDTGAFDELVRRYRTQLYGYVRVITQDAFLAEDVLQEALIRAFIHVGQLKDTERVLGWLHRIVRNQAYSYMQRQKRQREHYLSSFISMEHSTYGLSWSEPDSLDMLLTQRMSRTDGGAQEQTDDPYHTVADREMESNFYKMLAELNERDEQICKSHWMEQLSTQEIASRFNLAPTNVYQILSRSRKKVSQYHIYQSVDEMLIEENSLRPNQVMLKEPLSFRQPRTWNSAAAAIYGMLNYVGQSPSLPMVMGLSGLAFRLTILPGDIHIAGPTAYNFKEVLARGVRHMGYLPYAVEAVAREVGINANLADPSLLKENAKEKRLLHSRLVRALSLIRYSIHRGIPAVVWDLNIPEFGLIYGYDDEVRTLYGADFIKSGTIPYDHIGRGVNQEVFVLVVESAGMSREINIRAALTDILAHYRGDDPYTLLNTVSAIAAYAAWRDALIQGRVEPNGHAYNLAVLWDARYYASEFFKELSQRWAVDSRYKALIPFCHQAEGLYRMITERLLVLVRLFPFPDGGQPNMKNQADQAISILNEVEELERSAMDVIEALLGGLELDGWNHD